MNYRLYTLPILNKKLYNSNVFNIFVRKYNVDYSSYPEQLDSNVISDPRTIVKHLDDYVIGQKKAKKTLAVAVFNHYNRVRANLIREYEQQPQQQKSTIYYSDSDTKSFTEHHHPTISNLEYQTTNTTTDSITQEDQWSHQRRNWENPTTTSNLSKVEVMKPSRKRKVLIDDTLFDKSNVLLLGPTGSGKTLLARTLAQILQVPFSMSDATPFTQAGYVGEDVELVIQRLLQASDYDVKKAEMGIVFIDEIDKISRRTDNSVSRDVSGEGVQQSLLRMLEGTMINITSNNKRNLANGQNTGGGNKGETYTVDTSNILFILSGAFVGLDRTIQDRLAKGSIGFGAHLKSSDDRIETLDIKKENPLSLTEPSDLVKYGLIPEFVGRLPVIASVDNLSVHDLVRVLTEPKNSLLKQYQGLFAFNQVNLRFSKAALRKIAELALEKKTGARGLRRIMENLLLDSMYDSPTSNIKYVIINSKVVLGERKAIYLSKDQRLLGDKIILDDDEEDLNVENLQEVNMG